MRCHTRRQTGDRQMSNATKQMVLGWLAMHNGDVSTLARWMSQSVRIGGVKVCRQMIIEAQK